MIDIQELKDALEIIRLENVEKERLAEIQRKADSEQRKIQALAYIQTILVIPRGNLSLPEKKLIHYNNIDLIKKEFQIANYTELKQQYQIEIINQLQLINKIKDEQRSLKVGN